MIGLSLAGRGRWRHTSRRVGTAHQGISTKVLSERLRKLTAYGVLSKQIYAEVPPRTEYALSPTGQKLVHIIAQLNGLDEDIRRADHHAPVDAKKRRR